MLADRISNPGPLTYRPGALPLALRGQARCFEGEYLDTTLSVFLFIMENAVNYSAKIHVTDVILISLVTSVFISIRLVVFSNEK